MLPLRALISATSFKMSNQFEETKSGNRIDMKNRNQDGAKITLEEKMQSERSKDQKDGFSKGGQSIPSGVNIILWIVYVHYSITIACFKLPI